MGVKDVLASGNIVTRIHADDRERGQLAQLAGKAQSTFGCFTDSQECGNSWGQAIESLTSEDTAVTTS